MITSSAKEKNVGSARGQNASSLSSAAIDVPETHRTVVKWGDCQQRSSSVIPVVWVEQGHPASLYRTSESALVNLRSFEPVDACRSMALDILIVPRYTLPVEGWIPIRHVLKHLKAFHVTLAAVIVL